MKKKINFTVVWITSALTLLFFCGQQEISARKHKTVPEKKRIELRDGGPYKGVWETGDLTLDYEYTRETGRLSMVGQVNLKRSGSGVLNNFDLQANLIDTEGKIIDYKVIASAGGRRQIHKIPFKTEIKIPDQTWGVAFSYNGSTSGTGQGSGSSNRFWITPF